MDCVCKITDCVCKIIDPVVKCVSEIIEFLVNKLKETIIDEIKFQWGFNDEIKKLKDKLGELKILTFNPRPNASLAKVEEARHAAFDIEDVLEEFELLESNKPSNFCGVKNIPAFMHYFFGTAKFRFQFHQKVKSIEQQLVQQAVGQTAPEEEHRATAGSTSGGQTAPEEEHRPTAGSTSGALHIVGMDTEFSELLNLVEQPRNPMQVITVWGPGGSGKTTLVNKVFKRVEMNTEINCCAWVSVNQSSPIEVLRSMVKAISRTPGEVLDQKEQKRKDEELLGLSENELRQRILDDLKQKRYVLILDDVWEPEAIEHIAPLLPANNMSSVIVTSRQEDIATKLIQKHSGLVGSDRVKLKALNRKLSWELFCKAAFLNNNPPGSCPEKSIEKIGRELVDICDGLPLAILAIGKLMSTKGDNFEKWNDVRQQLDLELQGDLAQLNRVLLLSYDHLPIHLKSCFLYCAMFPKSVRISIHKLIRLWIAEGFVKHDDQRTREVVARRYFNELINRSMLQFRYESKGFQMHDLLREVVVHRMAEEKFGKLLYQNTLVEDQRRLAIHAPNVQLDHTGRLKLRSLVACNGEMFYSSLSQLLQSIKLIRTLDLEGVDNINNVPDEVGDLIHLRYLSLRQTKLCDLPDSVKKLRHLETLDVRNNEATMKHVPTGIAELKQLRHLLINRLFDDYLEMPDIALEFTQLQSLDGVHLNLNQATQLNSTTQLTKLKISVTGEESCEKIFTAMENMNNLQTLKLWARHSERSDTPIKLGNLPASSPLKKLTLKGFTGLGDLTASHKNLCEIQLSDCDLDRDSFSALGQLLRLEYLYIRHSYQGNQLICEAESFPALKEFWILRARDLTTWSPIPTGSMKCLRDLVIYACKSLQMLPDGLQELKNLQHLDLMQMEPEFLKRTETGGLDHWKIQHIPRIHRVQAGNTTS